MSGICNSHHKVKDCEKCLTHAINELCNGCYEYRSVDGSFNNKNNPNWGKSNTSFLRALGKSYYKDGVSEPIDNENPRDISNSIFDQGTLGEKESGVSAFFWLWGQYVDHSITLAEEGHEKFNIKIPKGDKYFDPASTGEKIINMTRSNPSEGTGTSVKNPREQTNTMSSYLDAANIYGNTEERLRYIRRYSDGMLKTSGGGTLPPLNDGNQQNGGDRNGLFVCGDVRSNEHLGLISIHTIFVKEHNHWAREINKCRPGLGDEEIFQKAKMIVESEIQCITYNEWLSILIGKEAVDKFPSKYNNMVNAQITDIFATAALRFGHTMVSPEVLRLDACGFPIYEGNIDLRSSFFSPHLICNEGGIEPILRGFAKSESERLDSKIIDDLRNFLFGEPGRGGMDLAAINIQRSRDHGLPSYNQTRERYGLEPIKNFREVNRSMRVIRGLEDAYKKDPKKGELWVCGLAENRYKGLVGETMFKILEDQFRRLKVGDRFYYEWRLPESMIEIIKDTKLSDIIVRNSEINEMRENIFII